MAKFDSKNTVHRRLSELSRELHQLRTKESEKEVARREGEVNAGVRELFGLPDAE
jgi:hypothetical protein